MHIQALLLKMQQFRRFDPTNRRDAHNLWQTSFDADSHIFQRYLEYYGLVLQDYDVIGDRGCAKEKLLIFVRRQSS